MPVTPESISTIVASIFLALAVFVTRTENSPERASSAFSPSLEATETLNFASNAKGREASSSIP
jgi:hypothetical protein